MNTKKLLFALSLLTLSAGSFRLHASKAENSSSLNSAQTEKIESLINDAILFVVKETTTPGFAGGFGTFLGSQNLKNETLWKTIEENQTVKNSFNALRAGTYDQLVYYIYTRLKKDSMPSPIR